MDGQADARPEPRLEGLVLRDGDGAYYEVPRVVIERYRVANPQSAPPGALPISGSKGDLNPTPDSAWQVAGGVYAPPLRLE